MEKRYQVMAELAGINLQEGTFIGKSLEIYTQNVIDYNKNRKPFLDKFERWFDIALRFGWVLFIYVVVTGNYIR